VGDPNPQPGDIFGRKGYTCLGGFERGRAGKENWKGEGDNAKMSLKALVLLGSSKMGRNAAHSDTRSRHPGSDYLSSSERRARGDCLATCWRFDHHPLDESE
jgi:hypothetical protein